MGVHAWQSSAEFTFLPRLGSLGQYLTVRSAGIERREVYTVRRRLHMGVAIFVAIYLALFVAIFSALIMSGKQWRAAEERARARRMAEHRMNARLLRLDI
jgi:hypothetical protein